MKIAVNVPLIYSISLLFLLISAASIYVLFQDNEKERELKRIVQQVQSYKSAIGTFEQRFGEHPAKLKNAKDFWKDAQEIPDDLPAGIGVHRLKGEERKGLGKALRIFQRLALSGNMPGEHSADRVGKNLIIPAKNPIFTNENVPTKELLLQLHANDELITPFQMNDYMALMLQGQYDPVERVRELKRQREAKNAKKDQ